MRRLLALLAAMLLLLAACSSEPTAEPGDGGTDATTGDDGGDGGNGDGNGDGGGDGEEIEGNDPPPQVEPSIPGEGESTAIEFEVRRSGTDPDEGDFSRPYLALIRNAEAAEREARRAPAAEAAAAIREPTDYTQTALIAVFGGAQPDSSYAIRVTNVSVTEGGEVISVSAKLFQREGQAAQVVSVPSIVITVDARSVVLGVRCLLATEGQSAIESRC